VPGSSRRRNTREFAYPVDGPGIVLSCPPSTVCRSLEQQRF
jgi:hypothetical protein